MSQQRGEKGRCQEVKVVVSQRREVRFKGKARGLRRERHPDNLRGGGLNLSHTFNTSIGCNIVSQLGQVCELLLLLSQEGMDLQTAGCLELAPLVVALRGGFAPLAPRSRHPFSSST